MKINHAIIGALCAVIMAGATPSSVFADSSGRPAGQELVFLTWPEYMAPELVEKFEEKFDATVKMIYFETEEEREQLISMTMGKGYDVVLASGVNTLNYIRRNWLSPLKSGQIPNLRYVDPRWLDAHPEITAHAVPYLWGTLGVAYRRDLIEKEVTSWKDLFEPDEKLRGKILMIKDSRELVGMALKHLGCSMNSNDAGELARAEALLLTQKPFVKRYGYLRLNEQSGLLTGEYWMAMVYNGDALTLRQYNPNVAFSVPREGSGVWMDYLMVMAASTKKELALSFINFLNQPEHAARLASYLNYASPNAAAGKLLPGEHLENLYIYPDQDVLKNCEVTRALPPRVQKRYNMIYSKIMHGKTER